MIKPTSGQIEQMDRLTLPVDLRYARKRKIDRQRSMTQRRVWADHKAQQRRVWADREAQRREHA